MRHTITTIYRYAGAGGGCQLDGAVHGRPDDGISRPGVWPPTAHYRHLAAARLPAAPTAGLQHRKVLRPQPHGETLLTSCVFSCSISCQL